MRTSTRLALAAAFTALAFVGSPFVTAAHGANELCGQTVTQSITLTADQSCTGDGLVLAGDKITIDLAGFTLSGDDGTADDGIDVSGAKKVVIRNGTIRNFGIGIATHGMAPDLVKVSKVTLRDNRDSGLRVGAGVVVVDKSSLTDNGLGIDATGDTVKITGTAVIGNLTDGIELRTNDGTVTKVLAMGNGSQGLVLSDGGAKLVIKASQFVRNALGGVRLTEASGIPGKILIAKNRIVGNGGPGVLGRGAGDPNHLVAVAVTGNVIAGNDIAGVRFNTDADGSIVSGNRIVGNRGDGVLIDTTSDGVLVKGNAIVGNNGLGISTANATTTIAKNVLTANDDPIVAPLGAIDGGGNKARANVDQSCAPVFCPPTFTPKPGPVTPTCGMVVTSSITLGADTPICAGDGIIITAVGVTVDLNGHQVRGAGTPGTSGIKTTPFLVRVTIANGIVRGFGTGISAPLTGALTISNVEVRDNVTRGASFSGESFVENSAFVGNAGSGLELAALSGVKITSSVFFGNEADGFRDNGSPATITKSVAAANGGVGVNFLAEGSGQLTKSVVAANGAEGVRMEGTFGKLAPVTLKKNDILGNGGDGILAQAEMAGAVLDGNLVGGNGGRGIALRGNPAATTLAKNDLVGNGSDGLFVDVIVQATTVAANRAFGNGGSGLNVDIAAATLVKNVAVGNALNGIRTPFGAIDGGGNSARDNVFDPQCTPPIVCP